MILCQSKGNGMKSPTKCCELKVNLKSGVSIAGVYHVPLGTSSSVRPADALRDAHHEFILLSDATICEDGESREHQTIMIQREAISYIELPQKSWMVPELCEAGA